jgi:phage baseplate assembly protein W
MSTFAHLGTDLAVVPGFAAHDAEVLDFTSRERPLTPLLRRLLTTHGLEQPAGAADLASVQGRENLAQALVLRLLTPRGALRALGHPEYGSRLGELIGERKTEALRARCRAFVLECVAQEPRVEDTATELSFDPAQEAVNSFFFVLGVRPVAGGNPVTLGLELAL